MIEEYYKQKTNMAVNLVEGIKRTGLQIVEMRGHCVKTRTR